MSIFQRWLKGHLIADLFHQGFRYFIIFYIYLYVLLEGFLLGLDVYTVTILFLVANLS